MNGLFYFNPDDSRRGHSRKTCSSFDYSTGGNLRHDRFPTTWVIPAMRAPHLIIVQAGISGTTDSLPGGRQADNTGHSRKTCTSLDDSTGGNLRHNRFPTTYDHSCTSIIGNDARGHSRKTCTSLDDSTGGNLFLLYNLIIQIFPIRIFFFY